MTEFSISDLSDEVYENNMRQADIWFAEGRPYSCSQGICESKTAGYGRLDCYGYWEFPLAVIEGKVTSNEGNLWNESQS